jgi:hypothetical protein
MRFASIPSPGTQAPTVHETIEMDPVDPSNGQMQTSEPGRFDRPTETKRPTHEDKKGKGVDRGEARTWDVPDQDDLHSEGWDASSQRRRLQNSSPTTPHQTTRTHRESNA